jgi:hypothetical protein
MTAVKSNLARLLALCTLRPVQLFWSNRCGRAVLEFPTVSAFLVHAPSVFQTAHYWNERIDIDRHTEYLWSWSRPPFLFPWQQ